MLDFHSHIIPGIDDGSKDTSMSLAMLELSRKQGVDYICATPHFYADMTSPDRFLHKRDAAYNALIDAMEVHGGFDAYPRIFKGAEVHYFRGMSACEDISRLCLQGTKLILIEMPFHEWTDYMIRDVAELTSAGLMPVAAHIERYLSIQSNAKIEDFLDTGILIQCNAEFFLTPSTKKKALRLLSENMIDFLGSDAHNLRSRVPNLGPAVSLIEKKLGSEALSKIQRNNKLLIEAWKIVAARGGAA